MKDKICDLLKNRAVLIILSIVIGIGAFELLINISNNNNKEEKVTILKATKDIYNTDGEIDSSMFEEEEVDSKCGLNYVTKEELKGKKVMDEIFEGEVISSDRLIDLDADNEESILYSLKLNPEDGVAGSIRKGDDVYILGTSAKGTDYVFKDCGEPVKIKIVDVYDTNSIEIQDATTVAYTFVLRLTKIQAKDLAAAQAINEIKLVNIK